MPVFRTLWVFLARIHRNPSIPVRFGLGPKFIVVAWGAANASENNLVSPAWLVVTYFLHTVGEPCLGPVGLPSVTELGPAARGGQMMGVWFTGTALSDRFGDLVAGCLEVLAPAGLFGNMAMIIGTAGAAALVLYKPIKELTGHVD